MVGIHGNPVSKTQDRDLNGDVPYIIGPDGAAIDPDTKKRISPSKLRRILTSRQRAARAKQGLSEDEMKVLEGGSRGGAMMFGPQESESIVQSGAPTSTSAGESKSKSNPIYGTASSANKVIRNTIDISTLMKAKWLSFLPDFRTITR